MNDDAFPTELEVWLRRLETAHPLDIDLGLDRVSEVARRMGLLDGPVARRLITVAGTNGKGSTVAMLEVLARQHGLSTATYTSPHLLRYNERLHLDGQEADDVTLVAGFEAVETARLDGEPISLTYFEVATLAALCAIQTRTPELAILEVGLGGRLDAVNIVDPDVAVITTIAHDHAAFLGNDLNGIGREKAGIMRTERPVVLGSRDLPSSVFATAETLAAPVYALGEAFGLECQATSWRWWSRAGCHIESLPDPGLPRDNAATALMALQLAGIVLDAKACRGGLASVTLPGRMQWHGAWCLDVGHNPQAAAYVAERLVERPVEGRTCALLGMLGDKDVDGVIEALAPAIDTWLPVSLEGGRARSAGQLAECLERHGQHIVHRAASPAAGAAWLAKRLMPDDRVLVCGSFFTVGEVLAGWEKQVQIESGDTSIEGMT